MRKEQEELFNCTFKPNILEISRKKSMPEQGIVTRFLDRQEIWLETKRNKAQKQASEKSAHTMDGCTFVPEVNENSAFNKQINLTQFQTEVR